MLFWGGARELACCPALSVPARQIAGTHVPVPLAYHIFSEIQALAWDIICGIGRGSPSARQLSMVRMSTIDRKQAPWHLRWFYAATSRMFGKELTPVKLQARVPRVVWAAILVEACLSGRRQVSLRHIQLGRIRAAARIGCPF